MKESQRNRDVFDEVSKCMVEHGHNCSDEECHSKTKSIRKAYTKTLVHYEKSDNSPTLCPYYDQLNVILKGDPIVKRCQKFQSLPRVTLSEEGLPNLVTIILQLLWELMENVPQNDDGSSNPALEG